MRWSLVTGVTLCVTDDICDVKHEYKMFSVNKKCLNSSNQIRMNSFNCIKTHGFIPKKMVWYYQIWVGLIECIVLWPPKKLLKCSVKKQATSPCFFFFKSRLGIALWGRGCETIRPRPWHSLLTKMQRVFFESFVGRITALLFSFFLYLSVFWRFLDNLCS